MTIERALPTFYLSHGAGPCFWMPWEPADLFEKLGESLREVPKLVGTRPKAALVISAHWEAPVFTLQTSPKPSMLYDYSGFPENTYQLKYPAPGSPWLVDKTKALLKGAGIDSAEDPGRGFDHGMFVPFLMMYPEADLPCVQLSLKATLDPAEHLALGRALSPLREEGVLIVGSGYSYHNLRQFHDREGVSEPFDAWLTETLADTDPESRNDKLKKWTEAPHARRCHPREDHLIPLMVAAGAAGADPGRKCYTEKMARWNFRASSFQFGG